MNTTKNKYHRKWYHKNKKKLRPKLRKYLRSWRKKNPDKDKVNRQRYLQSHKEHEKKYRFYYDLKRNYGLTPEAYDTLLQVQSSRCAICGEVPSGPGEFGKQRLFVDHDHKTGRVRGLLCSHCNVVLGNSHDNPRTLRRAAEYLEH